MKQDPFQGLNGGLGTVVIGPPGTGKSWLLGTAAALFKAQEVALLTAKPREGNSFLYRKHGIVPELYHDPKWRPSVGSYEASAFVRFNRRLEELYDDETIRLVLVDPFTDIVSIAMHEILKPYKAASPNDSGDGMGIYGTLKHRLKETTQALTALQYAPTPKHVVVAIHAQAPKEDQQLPRSQGGGVKASADKRAKGVSYEGDVLPMIEGGYRTEFAGEFDAVLFTDIRYKLDPKTRKQVPEYVLQVTPDATRHAKQALIPALAETTIPNDFGELLRLIQQGVDS